MFLKTLLRRNESFLSAVVTLHQSGQIPANSYVLDLDTIETNAAILAQEAAAYKLKLFAMTKQIGRNIPALRAMVRGGIQTFVAVDLQCARPIHAAGLRLGHIGHLVQIPRAEAEAAARMTPDYWTVFSLDKAREASAAAASLGREQTLLARIFAEGDTFYMGHEGGFPAEDIVSVASQLDALSHARFGGITTFPALLFDDVSGRVSSTPNLSTLERAVEALTAGGRTAIEVNAPGTNSSVLFEALAGAGATQVEPGHAITGTTPLHAVQELPEAPAILYVSEVSHFYGGKAYCFGGGLYIDPVFPAYDVHALVGPDPRTALGQSVRAMLPSPSAIDYYGILSPDKSQTVKEGDTVIFGFRAQAFVTRAFIAPVSGIAQGKPQVEGIWNGAGGQVDWPI